YGTESSARVRNREPPPTRLRPRSEWHRHELRIRHQRSRHGRQRLRPRAQRLNELAGRVASWPAFFALAVAEIRYYSSVKGILRGGAHGAQAPRCRRLGAPAPHEPTGRAKSPPPPSPG